MKPLKGIEDWNPQEQPSTNPWQALGFLTLLVLAILVILAMNSCKALQSIPFSVSYQDDQGETFTVTKGVTPITHDK